MARTMLEIAPLRSTGVRSSDVNTTSTRRKTSAIFSAAVL
jgi:hypothetical protein